MTSTSRRDLDFLWSSRPAALTERDACGEMAIPLHHWQRGDATGPGRTRTGLRVAVVCDASRSMAAWMPALASLAWIVAASAHGYLDGDAWARSAVVRVGHEVGLLGAPRRTEPDNGVRDYPLTHFPLDTDHARLDDGLRIAETTLGLHSPGHRLIVLITGADASSPECLQRARQTLARLRRSGCRALWLCPTSALCDPSMFPGAYPHLIDVERHRHDSRYEPAAWRALGVAALAALTWEAPDPSPLDPSPADLRR